MFDNYSPFSEDIKIDYNEGEIENSQMSPDLILRAAKAAKEKLENGKEEVPFSLMSSADENLVSQYNIRVNDNIYSLAINKWDGVFKRMDHDLENTSVVIKAGSIEVIEQDFTIEMESYLEDEGFDIEVEDNEISGPDAEKAREFLDEKFNL